MSTNLKNLIKVSSEKSSQINNNTYQDTLAAQIAKADAIMGGASSENISKAPASVVERILITLPKIEHENLNLLVEKYLSLGKHVTKSELVRLGIQLIEQLSDESKISKLKMVVKLKSGRKNYNAK
ncbi:MAG: hypothetical protein KBD37_06540 [Burkholderiales bacterium]|nr:hypothetical protein [Burkholderiales bacterium]